MQNVSSTDRLESLRSLESTIKKLENALSQMTQNGANITLVKKRLRAHQIGLALLNHIWNQVPLPFKADDFAEARNVINAMLPSIKNSYVKSKIGSPQKTLLERRIKSLELVILAIGEA